MMNLKKLIILNALVFGVAILSFGQVQMNLLDNLTYSNKTLNDIWGWSSGSNEYALVGLTTGLSVVNVTNPANVSEVQSQSGITSTWRDIKTWGNYAYVSNESGNGVEIFNLSGLPISMTNSFWTGNNGVNFQTAHNLYIDEFGILYVFGANYGVGGAIMADVAANPTNPPVVGVYNNAYCHDGFARNNILYTSEIYAGEFGIVNVSNKSNPIVLQTQATTSNFTHNAWLSDNSNYLFTTDEVNGAEVGSYDISNLNNIQRLDGHFTSLSSGTAPHNTHVLNDCLITSWYRDGVNVVDATDPSLLVEVAYYDTYPQGAGGGFDGCWGAYPFLPSGNILASDQVNGLFVLEGGCPCAVRLTGNITDANGSPINGATVTVTGSSGLTTTSDFTGYYGSGTPTAGTYTVTYNAPGYAPQTFTISLTNCQTVNQDVQLVLQGACSQSGQITDAATGAPINGAFVIFDDGAGYTATANTNGSGNFSTSIPSGGGYTVTVGKWGYLAEVLTNQTACGNLNINLDAGYCDDFALDYGWTATSNGASTGFWELGEPIGTGYNGVQSNPEVDVNNDNGNQCYVTGNGGGDAGNDDIDGGEVILTSPVFNLSTYSDPYIDYDRWFFNDGSNPNPNDQLVVEISNNNGSSYTNIETITDGNQESQWVNNNFRVLNYTSLTANMRLRFRASDTGQGHLVEAGADDFCVVENGCSSTAIAFNMPASTSTVVPITLTASPPGGTFSGPGVVLSAFNPSLVGPGQYDITYTYTDANGCVSTATETIFVFSISFNFVTYTLGTISPKILEEINESLTTYPNPVISDLEFNFYVSEQIEEGLNYAIYDINGKKMLEEQIYINDHLHQQKVDMTNFDDGVYIMQISNSAGAITKRIVKQ